MWLHSRMQHLPTPQVMNQSDTQSLQPQSPLQSLSPLCLPMMTHLMATSAIHVLHPCTPPAHHCSSSRLLQSTSPPHASHQHVLAAHTLPLSMTSQLPCLMTMSHHQHHTSHHPSSQSLSHQSATHCLQPLIPPLAPQSSHSLHSPPAPLLLLLHSTPAHSMTPPLMHCPSHVLQTRIPQHLHSQSLIPLTLHHQICTPLMHHLPHQLPSLTAHCHPL